MLRITLFLFLIIIISLLQAISSARSECGKGRVVKFEKIVGIRPRSSFHPNLLHQAKNDGKYPSITIDCLTKCLEIVECSSFVLFYENSSCYWFTEEISNLHEEEETLFDADVAWFQKTCFHEPKVCDKIWTFERIPGATLIGNNTKQLPNAVKRSECQQACLDETKFECRSAKFRIERFSNHQHSEASGFCTLSDADRHSVPSAYRASRLDEEYLENQCTKNLTNVFCAFEEFPDVRLGHSDASLSNASESQCRSECDAQTIFGCRGYTLLPGSRSHLFTCLMHGENSKLHGPRALVHHAGAKYYERAPCLNVTVTCSRNEMLVRFQPEIPFHGRLYMNGYSDDPECYALGNDRALITLRLPLTVHRCGILEARSLINRTLMSSTMIVQYNSLVQTQSDRIINVGCIFTNDTKVVVGTGFNVSRDHTGLGSSVINSSVSLPTVDMRIVDLSTNGDISDTEIGDDLKLIIEMHPRNNGFDIWAGHLIAMTENGRESILLLDDRGCPTNLDIFPSLQKIYSNDSVTLTSTFQAFKFSSSNILRFSVIVQFCSGKCPSIDCGAIYNVNKRRAVVDEDANVISKLNRSSRMYEEEVEGSVLEEMPLEFILIVRSATVRQDRLIHGENNRILVAGYDLNTNEVCLDFSLLIGIAITWILIQIILLVCCVALIRRYKKHYEDRQLSESVEELHKNFGLGFSNLENARRVRFADGHLT